MPNMRSDESSDRGRRLAATAERPRVPSGAARRRSAWPGLAGTTAAGGHEDARSAMTTKGNTQAWRRRRFVAAAGLVATLVAAVVPTSSQATFRGKHGQILYAAPAGRFEQIFTVRPDGSGRRQITRFA